MQNLFEKTEVTASHVPSSLKRCDLNVKAIQDILKKNGVKMSAIEIRELMRNRILAPNENSVKAYLRQLRQGF